MLFVSCYLLYLFKLIFPLFTLIIIRKNTLNRNDDLTRIDLEVFSTSINNNCNKKHHKQLHKYIQLIIYNKNCTNCNKIYYDTLNYEQIELLSDNYNYYSFQDDFINKIANCL